jgi:acylphosphatase
MKKQLHVYFDGRVQGVGFRFTAIEIAREIRVCGWVKNMDDGRVEVVAEAEEESVKDFLHEISQCFSRYIRDTNVEWLDATGEFKDFTVKF